MFKLIRRETQLKYYRFLTNAKDEIFLEILSGSGGKESCDWVKMLYNMYSKYCIRSNFKNICLSQKEGIDGIGSKAILAKIEGKSVYNLLCNETGTHRLIRKSPFNPGRHTTFGKVIVYPVTDSKEINLNEITIDTFRSSGPGGQHVNKTESAVRITHIPTGIVVQCQNQRSQHQNRSEGLKLLQAKLMRANDSSEKMEKNRFRKGIGEIDFGNQIRTYTFDPYQLIKDHRSSFSTSQCEDIMNGELEEIIKSLTILNK